MKTRTLFLLATIALSGCGGDQRNPNGPNGAYGMIENERVFGVVVSVNESDDPTVNHVGGAVAATEAGNGITAAEGAVSTATAGSTLLSPFSSIFGSVADSSRPKAPTPTVGDQVTIHYVIRKDDGQQISIDVVPEEGEQISYPGQRVMIQSNGKYLQVYPSDVEDPLQRHVPGGPRGGA